MCHFFVCLWLWIAVRIDLKSTQNADRAGFAGSDPCSELVAEGRDPSVIIPSTHIRALFISLCDNFCWTNWCWWVIWYEMVEHS